MPKLLVHSAGRMYSGGDYLLKITLRNFLFDEFSYASASQYVFYDFVHNIAPFTAHKRTKILLIILYNFLLKIQAKKC